MQPHWDAILAGDTVAFGDLRDLRRQLRDLRQIARLWAHPYQDDDRKAEHPILAQPIGGSEFITDVHLPTGYVAFDLKPEVCPDRPAEAGQL